jgi:hypothetical protein
VSRVDNIYTNLGAGILLRDDSDGPAEIDIGGTIRFRFMDRLYLPTRTDRLSIEQIQVINRFRELEIAAGPGLAYRNRLRSLVKSVVCDIGDGGLMEIGCGKFPLSAEVPSKIYHGVEVDEEAITENQRRGVLCTRDVDVVPAVVQQCDLCVALFVFHFHVTEATLDLVTNDLPASAVLMFNVVSRQPEIRTRVALDLVRRGLWLGALDLSDLGASDILYFASREVGVARALAARRCAEALLLSPPADS